MAKSLGATLVAGFGSLVGKAAVPSMNVVNTSALVREPFSGAWQRNIQIDNREALLAFSAVYACVTRIAADIAKLRIKLVRFTDDRIWAEVFEQSPFWPVLRKPNAWQNRIQFLTDWVLMKLLYGNAYILKQRDLRGMVVALYVLDSRRVKPVVTRDGDVYYQLQQDDLAGVKGGPIVPAMEIIHDRGPTLWHPLVGVSPIYACGASSTQGNRIQTNSAKFFENMSRPGGVLSVPGDLDDATFIKMKTEFNDNYSGAGAGRTALLTNGIKYEPFAVAAHDAQLIEQLEWTVQDVARAFGMPLYKIGAGPVPTNNNVEALQQQYYSDCLQIQIEAIELCMDEGLRLDQVPGQTLGCELDLEGLMRMDSAAQMDALTKGVGAAIYSPNEARAMKGLPPVVGGASPMIQQQNFSLAALAKRDARPDPFVTAPPPAPPPSPGASSAAADDDDSSEEAKQLALKAIASLERTETQSADRVKQMLEQFAADLPTVVAAELAKAAEQQATETSKFADDLLAGLAELEPLTLLEPA